ncbi:helix-turn-helix transcriptional regulator [Roseateles koreensis]|uniref:LuxR C-terminal-related transcriptional regulator n=1 Tax=Roseateles koreensis TaxID=2987526 RepID=A0ABT5KQ45_9BURK|nr:LuxR C-terminal-related transcriptional regulator [Roseateles koreensis]MDC8785040.1 LuxR C-terminal-related transcriptional regulator [Roseateles koreensis]
MPLLVAPQPSRYLVDNPNLAGWLEECDDVTLVLATAPAGFGKTTAMLNIYGQLQERGYVTAWIQLSAQDNHLESFCALMQSALSAGTDEGAAPQPLPNLMDARYTGSQRGQDVLDAVAQIAKPTALFLDDFDHLREPRVIDLMQRLIERLPAHCKLFITARSAPLLRLYKLKAQGRLLQIGMTELSFDFDQAEQFLNQRHQLALDATSVRRLVNATEGWPAGLQLAALALKARGDKRGFIENFCEQTADIGRYLYEEVLWDQPDDLKNFLLLSSPIKQLNPGICNAVVQISNAAQLLRQLEQQSLFILRMGAAGNEYRYHPLFAEFLERKLGEDMPEALPGLHQRAASWFLQTGDAANAINHALLAGNYAQACEILSGHAWGALARGHISSCRQWLSSVPQHILADYPQLLVVLSWAHIFQYDYAQAGQIARELKSEPRVQDLPEYRLLEPLSLVMMDRVAEGEAILESYANIALTGLSEAVFTCLTAYVDLCSHRFESALLNADRARLLLKRLGGVYGTTFSYGIAQYTLLAMGQAQQAIQLLEPTVAELGRSGGRHSVSAAYVGLYLAGALYEIGEFDRAESLAREYLDLVAELVFLDAIVIAHRILSRVLCRRGQYAEASALIVAGAELGRSLGFARIVAPMRMEQQYQLIHQMDHGHASTPVRLSLHTQWDFDAERMTPINDVEDQAVAALRQGLREGRAADVLEACASKRVEAGALGRQRRHLKLSILQAQALHLLGRDEESRRLLTELLRSPPGQQLHASFLEEGPQVVALLRAIRAETIDPALLTSLDHLLSRVPTDVVRRPATAQSRANGGPDSIESATSSPSSGAAPVSVSTDSPAPDAPPIEGFEALPLEGRDELDGPHTTPAGLSTRELQILQCLAAGMSNKQIASNLHISEPTVKFHLRNVNHKLDARNRTHAVFIARERGWVR